MKTFMSRTLSWVTLIGAVTASLYAATPAKAAEVIYDSLSATSTGATDICQNVCQLNPSVGPLFDSFSTPGSSFEITQISIRVGLNGNTLVGPPFGGFGLDLYDDSGANTPGGVFSQTFGVGSDDNNVSATLGVVTFSNLSLTLNANTRYWIGLGSDNTQTFWSFTNNTSGTGVADEFFSNLNGTFSNSGSSPYQMEISGNIITTPATPLPGTLPLFATGLGALGLLGWRRKRKARARVV